MVKKNVGLLKWFDTEKKFGRIGAPGLGDVFLHYNQLVEKPDAKILKATAFVFDVAETPKGLSAVNAYAPKSFEDFELILSHLKDMPTVPIEVTVTGESRFGNPYKRNDTKHYSLVNAAAHQLLRKLDIAGVGQYFKSYFDKHLTFRNDPLVVEFYKFAKEQVYSLKIVPAGDVFADEGQYSAPNMLILTLFNHCLPLTDPSLLFEIWQQKINGLEVDSGSVFYKTVVHGNYYDFPVEIYEKHFEKLNGAELDSICMQLTGPAKISRTIENKLRAVNFGLQVEVESMYQKIIKLSGQDLRAHLLDALFQQASERLNAAKMNTDTMSGILGSLIKIKKDGKCDERYDQLVSQLNLALPDDLKFRLWQQTRYFEADETFLEKFLPDFKRNDFLSAPLALNKLNFERRLKQLGELATIQNFGLLTMQIIENPFNAFENIKAKLPAPYQIAYWLYFKRHTPAYATNKHYEFAYTQGTFEPHPDELLKFGRDPVDLQNALLAAELTSKLQQAFFSRSREEGFTDLSGDQRLEMINEQLGKIANSPQYKPVPFFKELFEQSKPEARLTLLKNFVPGIIGNPEEELTGLVEYFHRAEIEDALKAAATNYLSLHMSKAKRAELFSDDYLQEIDLPEIFEAFSQIRQDRQSLLLRKIFYCYKRNGKPGRDVFLVELFKLAALEKIDLNARIVIAIIRHLYSGSGFIIENQFSQLVCTYVNEHVTGLIRIDDLFQRCKGRTWLTADEDIKAAWYLQISGREFLVDDDKVTISGRYYEFDKQARTLTIDGLTYPFKWVKKPNKFYAQLGEVPKGVTFCDAVRSQTDENTGVRFYWCCNKPCFAPCQNDLALFEWRDYSLRDFLKLLDIPYDPEQYYNFLSMVNRANRLFSKLVCQSCRKLLRDKKTSEFAFYRVTTFHCTNEECKAHHTPVYLSHCLNWKCNNVVDDRVSKRCPNGWVICDSCHECCSNKGLNRRLDNLRTNNALNMNSPLHQRLVYQVEHQLGHLESGQTFDFETGLPKQ